MTEHILEIIDLTVKGEGLAKTEQGMIVFIPYAVPGDIVKAEITPFKKNIHQAKKFIILKNR